MRAFPAGAGRLAASVLLAACPAAGEVWIVGQGPGTDFEEIQPAVDAASDGDVVLVRASVATYDGFIIDDKALSVIAEESFEVVLDTPIVVRNLSQAREVLVRGLIARSQFLPVGARAWCEVVDSRGPVWVEASILGSFIGSGDGADGVHVTRSGPVTFTSSRLEGGAGSLIFGGTTFMPGGEGLVATDSTVSAFESRFLGGPGPGSLLVEPQPGGHALLATRSTVVLSACDVDGGDGGSILECIGRGGAPGGAGVVLNDASSLLQVTASTIDGGEGGDGEKGCGSDGADGPDFAGPGSVVELPGAAHLFSVGDPAAAGESISLELGGEPGELVALLVATGAVPKPYPAPAGLLLVDLPPPIFLSLGAIPSTGELELHLPVPSLGASEALVFYAQAAFVDGTLAQWLGSGATFVLLADELGS